MDKNDIESLKNRKFVIQDKRTDEYLGARGSRYADEQYLTFKQATKFKQEHADELENYDLFSVME